MTGKIDKILHRVPKEHGWVTYALIDGDEVSGFSRDKHYYQVGDVCTYYFDDSYNKGKLNAKKPVDKHSGYVVD